MILAIALAPFLLAPGHVNSLGLDPLQENEVTLLPDPSAGQEGGRRVVDHERPFAVTSPDVELQIRIIDVSDLTGADRLVALREAISNELLDEEVRYAALERYLELVESGEFQARAQSLADAIETFSEPEVAGVELRIAVPGPGELIVAADARVHAWIDGFLTSMRQFDGLIDIEVVTFLVADGTAADVWDGRTAVTLDDKRTSGLMERLMQSSEVERLDAPRVLTSPARHASLFTGEQTAYIKDYQFTVLPDRDVQIADPVIDVVQTGTAIDVLAIPIANQGLAVEIEFAQSTAERPFKEFTTTLGAASSPVTVQLPEVTTSKVDARFELAPGSAIALTVKDPSDRSKDIVVIMRAKRVAAERVPFDTDADPFDPKGGRRR